MGISQTYLCVMKSMERVRATTMISSSALVLNIFLNAVFIFGLFGAPQLGIMGVALATSIARGIELLLCAIDLKFQNTVVLKWKKMFQKDKLLFGDFIRFSLPVSYTHLDVYKRQWKSSGSDGRGAAFRGARLCGPHLYGRSRGGRLSVYSDAGGAGFRYICAGTGDRSSGI